ncbi:MAG: hypothetical protein KJN85_15195 [Maribacter sp.]|nr:hypothetical protein [Maribacter sp.]MBT8313595.1 hypothetical protein [Maribacter sp.]
MKKLFTILFITLMFISCSSDDNDNLDTTPTPLEGKWILTNVFCFCSFGENPDFSGHKLTFEGNNLKVENTGEFDFLADAEGIFSLQGDVITFKNGIQYTYALKTDVMAISFIDNPQIADDEILLTYKRG